MSFVSDVTQVPKNTVDTVRDEVRRRIEEFQGTTTWSLQKLFADIDPSAWLPDLIQDCFSEIDTVDTDAEFPFEQRLAIIHEELQKAFSEDKQLSQKIDFYSEIAHLNEILKNWGDDRKQVLTTTGQQPSLQDFRSKQDGKVGNIPSLTRALNKGKYSLDLSRFPLLTLSLTAFIHKIDIKRYSSIESAALNGLSDLKLIVELIRPSFIENLSKLGFDSRDVEEEADAITSDLLAMFVGIIFEKSDKFLSSENPIASQIVNSLIQTYIRAFNEQKFKKEAFKAFAFTDERKQILSQTILEGYREIWNKSYGRSISDRLASLFPDLPKDTQRVLDNLSSFDNLLKRNGKITLSNLEQKIETILSQDPSLFLMVVTNYSPVSTKDDWRSTLEKSAKTLFPKIKEIAPKEDWSEYTDEKGNLKTDEKNIRNFAKKAYKAYKAYQAHVKKVTEQIDWLEKKEDDLLNDWIEICDKKKGKTDTDENSLLINIGVFIVESQKAIRLARKRTLKSRSEKRLRKVKQKLQLDIDWALIKNLLLSTEERETDSCKKLLDLESEISNPSTMSKSELKQKRRSFEKAKKKFVTEDYQLIFDEDESPQVKRLVDKGFKKTLKKWFHMELSYEIVTSSAPIEDEGTKKIDKRRAVSLGLKNCALFQEPSKPHKPHTPTKKGTQDTRPFRTTRYVM